MNLIERFRLFFGLLSGERAFIGPPFIHLDVTRRCNLRCPGCRFHASDVQDPCYPGDHAVVDIPLERVRQVAREASRLAIREVILAGDGEPLLHPELPDIVACLKQAGCAIRLYTNGACLAAAGEPVLFEPGVDDLIVSLWASTPEEYARCYPSNPHLFEQVSAGVQSVAARRSARGARTPRITLCGPITRDNFSNLGGRVELARRLGADAVEFTAYRQTNERHAVHALDAGELRALGEELSGIRRLADKLGVGHNIPDLLRQHRLGQSDWKTRPCYIGWLHLNVHVDGTVTACGWCPAPAGHLDDGSLESIWNGPGLREFRRAGMTPGGWTEFSPHCMCDWCCFTKDIHRVHRVFRPFLPLARARGQRLPHAGGPHPNQEAINR
jgi:MoaA/NifB/PqqE/SkfB family radical SAM enzyme